MPWWSWRSGSASGGAQETDDVSSTRGSVRVGVPAQREPSRISVSAELSKSELSKSELSKSELSKSELSKSELSKSAE